MGQVPVVRDQRDVLIAASEEFEGSLALWGVADAAAASEVAGGCGEHQPGRSGAGSLEEGASVHGVLEV